MVYCCPDIRVKELDLAIRHIRKNGFKYSQYFALGDFNKKFANRAKEVKHRQVVKKKTHEWQRNGVCYGTVIDLGFINGKLNTRFRSYDVEPPPTYNNRPITDLNFVHFSFRFTIPLPYRIVKIKDDPRRRPAPDIRTTEQVRNHLSEFSYSNFHSPDLAMLLPSDHFNRRRNSFSFVKLLHCVV